MTNHMIDALYKDKEIISKASLEEYKNSSLTRTPTVYGEYKSFESGFNTVKEHPGFRFDKTLMYPKIHKASELFTDVIVAHDGVGNANHAKIPSGYLFMWDHGVEGPVRKILDDTPKLKVFKQAYVKPSFKHASWDDTGGWFVGTRSYEMHDWKNDITGKMEWLVVGIDPTGISHHWLAMINEWDIKPSQT